LLNSPHLTVFQADFDPVWVVRGAGQNIFDDSAGQFAAPLILFQDDINFDPGFDLTPVLTAHRHSFPPDPTDKLAQPDKISREEQTVNAA
jgi:hypothetical protein